MLPILAAAQRRDDAIRAARQEYERENAKLKMKLQEAVDNAERQFSGEAHRGLCRALAA